MPTEVLPVPFVPEAVQGPAAMLDSFDSPLPMAGTAATYGVTLTPLANVLQRMFGAHESNSLSASERG
jgi:hypothetical protein